jgi:5-methyltetrahydropteroyltriglutamate--homocysteine methyltransferase
MSYPAQTEESAHPHLPGFPLLPVTVVGSYPIAPTPKELMRSYYTKEDPFITAIKQSVREQAETGVHIISDGQTRANMVNIFASKLAGVRMKGKPQVFSEIQYTGPITIADQQYVLNVIEDIDSPPRQPTQQTSPLLKGDITGPHTMSQSVTDIYYNDEKELSFAFAQALNQEARALQEIVPILQIDEPFFSVSYVDYAGELIAEILDGITIPVSLHVCGDITPIFEDLIEMPVTILDHEFTANPHLLKLVQRYDFDQMFGFGVVRSNHNKVEPVDWIEKRIRAAVDAFGVERVMVDPDCGLKHLTRDVARRKLENMREARDRVLKDSGLGEIS